MGGRSRGDRIGRGGKGRSPIGRGLRGRLGGWRVPPLRRGAGGLLLGRGLDVSARGLVHQGEREGGDEEKRAEDIGKAHDYVARAGTEGGRARAGEDAAQAFIALVLDDDHEDEEDAHNDEDDKKDRAKNAHTRPLQILRAGA